MICLAWALKRYKSLCFGHFPVIMQPFFVIVQPFFDYSGDDGRGSGGGGKGSGLGGGGGVPVITIS